MTSKRGTSQNCLHAKDPVRKLTYLFWKYPISFFLTHQLKTHSWPVNELHLQSHCVALNVPSAPRKPVFIIHHVESHKSSFAKN